MQEQEGVSQQQDSVIGITGRKEGLLYDALMHEQAEVGARHAPVRYAPGASSGVTAIPIAW